MANVENQGLSSSSLGGVQQTLLIPLWARAKESENENPVLVDRQAARILKALSFDSTRMDKTLGEYYQLTYAIRARMLDDEMRAFLVRHPAATVVNIGAGLDMGFERIDNGSVHWYDLDLPDVVALRTKLVPETERSKCIAKSVLDLSWFEDIGQTAQGLLFVACGVFPYLRENQVRFLFAGLADRFQGAEMVFDIASRFFVWAGKWIMWWGSGIRTQAYMKWGIDSAREIARWDKRFLVVDEYPFFSRIAMDESWSKETVHAMRRADRVRGFNIVHLKLGV
jgi:O-methyltransferase involved in polyketide biosynthesis